VLKSGVRSTTSSMWNRADVPANRWSSVSRAMWARSLAAETLRVVISVALLVLLGTVASACHSSRSSEDQRFGTALKSACESYAAEIRATSRREQTEPATGASGGVSTASFEAEQRWLEQLRQLTPPASTGVTARAWRKAIDLQLRDARAGVALYGREFAKVVRSWKRPLKAPKLPPGTGPTAAVLAQAFNSPEGRRFLRLQSRLFKQVEAHWPAWERMLKAVGLPKACAGTKNGKRLATTAPATTTRR
jgi:hypothetical protein